MRPLHLVATVVLLTGLACAGWVDHDIDMVEVDRRVATEAGYTMPLDATAIYIRDQSTGDTRTTWFRYALPADPMEDLLAELEDDPGVLRVDSAVPADWPDFSTVGVSTPEWFTPSGKLFRRELPSVDGSVPSGRLWALADEGQVYTWVWTYEGWVFQPDAATVGQPAQ